MASTELTKAGSVPAPRGSEMEAVEVAFRIGQAAAQAGNYKSKNAAELALRVKYGMEMGLGPATALQSVTVIQGSPTLTAGAIASRISAHPDYDYDVTAHTDESCTIVIWRHKRGEWRECPPSTFTMEDAKQAGLVRSGPWKQYPRNMLFARALTNAARWYAAEVFGGAVYTPDEMGAEVDQDGEVVRVPANAKPPEPAPEPEPEPAPDATTAPEAVEVLEVHTGEPEPEGGGWDPKAVIGAFIDTYGKGATQGVLKNLGVSKYTDLTPELYQAANNLLMLGAEPLRED